MFKLTSSYKISEAQKKVVDDIIDNYKRNISRQVLLGVTGSGKTFIMAHIIKELNTSALILSPNKTLAAQLYQEFRGFFPHNKIGYFISYYDYYQPEAYMPQRNLYVAKEVSINPELERLRINASRNLLESKHTIIVASVSSIYSIGSPDDFFKQKISYNRGSQGNREGLLREFVSLGYNRTEDLIESGKFRVRGDFIEIFPTSEEHPIRFILKDDNIELMETFDAITAEGIDVLDKVNIFPISYFYYKKSNIHRIIKKIKKELAERIEYFRERGKFEYAERLKGRTGFDIELLTQYGYCPGIENYSFFLTKRKLDEPPYTILDFFQKEFITIIDESHITVPQIRAMYRGDRSRKETLVKYGFRLPSALENRPLRFDEFDHKLKKLLYVSATPTNYEKNDSKGCVSSLLVRPTGLLDPKIECRFSESPVEDMISEIRKEAKNNNRILVTTLTKKMAEKLTDFLTINQIKATYMHSEISTLDRIKILKKLRIGEVDVLVGINLLREGLDLPEVSLVIVLDADREGFLRSDTSFIQIFGRAARNLNGRVLLYMRKTTGSVERAVSESNRRRDFQIQYNETHGIKPVSITKKIKDFYDDNYWIKKSEEELDFTFNSRESLLKEIEKLTTEMKQKADLLEFNTAAAIRDRIIKLKSLLIEMF